jgi:hypothetical protein
VTIVLVRSTDALGMPNRTPILFGPAGDFTHVRENAIRVSAVQAVELLDRIQVGEVLAIDDDIPPPRDPCDAVGTKANRLIQRASVDTQNRQLIDTSKPAIN